MLSPPQLFPQPTHGLSARYINQNANIPMNGDCFETNILHPVRNVLANPLVNTISQQHEQPDVRDKQQSYNDSSYLRVTKGIEIFPEKLHRMLRETEAAGLGDIASFVGTNEFTIDKPVSPLLCDYFPRGKIRVT